MCGRVRGSPPRSLRRKEPINTDPNQRRIMDTKTQSLPLVDPTPIITESVHTIAARDLLLRVRAVQELAGAKTVLHPAERKKLNGTSGVPDEFLEDVAVALEAYSILVAASEASAAEMRDTVDHSRAYAPLVRELLLAARALAHAIAARRSTASQKALKVYKVAQAINRPSDEAMLVPHLAAMKRSLGRSGRKAAAGDPVVPTVKRTP